MHSNTSVDCKRSIFVEISRSKPNFILNHICQWCHLVDYLHTRKFWTEPGVFPHKHTFLFFIRPSRIQLEVLSCQSQQCLRKGEQNAEMRRVQMSLSFHTFSDNTLPGCFYTKRNLSFIVNMFLTLKALPFQRAQGSTSHSALTVNLIWGTRCCTQFVLFFTTHLKNTINHDHRCLYDLWNRKETLRKYFHQPIFI